MSKQESIHVSQADLERVLIGCLRNQDEAGVVSRPVEFLDSFKGLTKDSVLLLLQALQARGLVKLQTADYPESSYIDYIQPLTTAFDYLIEQKEKREAYRKNRRWNIATAFVTGLISSLVGGVLGAVLARLSQVIWP